MIINIGFSKPKNRLWVFGYLLSWLIRLFENTSYSHVFIRWYSESLDRELVYEASGLTVHFISGENFDHKAETVFNYEIEIDLETKRRIVQKAVDYANSPYGLKQLIGLLIVKIFRLFKFDIKNPFADNTATWVCSEIIGALLLEIGYQPEISMDNITPKDIQIFLERFNGKT